MVNRQDFYFGMTLDSDVLDGSVPFHVFVETFRDIELVLQDIEKSLVGGDARIEWGLDTDPEIRVIAHVNGVSEATIGTVVSTAMQAVDAARGQNLPWPSVVATSTRTRVRRIIQRLRTIAPVTVTATDNEPVLIERESTPSALPTIARPRLHSERSAVDGHLGVINVHGRPHFVIFEHGTNRRVTCSLADDLLPLVKDALNSRVVVEGIVRYREDGTPVAVMDTTSLKIVPQPQRSVEELRGAIPDLTGDMSTAEYLRELRTGNDDR